MLLCKPLQELGLVEGHSAHAYTTCSAETMHQLFRRLLLVWQKLRQKLFFQELCAGAGWCECFKRASTGVAGQSRYRQCI